MIKWHPIVILTVAMWANIYGLVLNAQIPANVAGEYTIAGDSPKGAYTGTAVVYQKDRVVFIQWISQAGDTLQGFGLITGDFMAVAYAAEDVGIAVVYQIKRDTLVGEWPTSDGTLWPETLTAKSAPRPHVHHDAAVYGALSPR